MAYLILKRKLKWALVYRQYSGHKILKTRTVELGTPEADSLGVFRGMSKEDADKALRLNRADGKARYHAERRARLAEKAMAREMATTAWLPESVLKDFEKEILPTISGRRDRWLIVKDILCKIDIPPYEWHTRAELFWGKFSSKGWSIGYVRRLLFYVNKWGAFYCRRTGKQWTPIPKPTGSERTKIQVKHYEKNAHRPTHEMSVEHLERARAILEDAQYNSLSLAFWCGLRKEELDFVLSHPSSPETWYMDQDRRGFHVFHLFQEKLRRKGIEPRLCWKAVPLVEPEQESLIDIIARSNFKTVPLGTLKKDVGVVLTNRSARKGFSVEMEGRGYNREYINEWLGHVGTTTAARNYRSRKMAMYAPPTIWEPRKKA